MIERKHKYIQSDSGNWVGATLRASVGKIAPGDSLSTLLSVLTHVFPRETHPRDCIVFSNRTGDFCAGERLDGSRAIFSGEGD